MLVIGIATSKQQKDPNNLKPFSKPKATALQMDFVVTKENAELKDKIGSLNKELKKAKQEVEAIKNKLKVSKTLT